VSIPVPKLARLATTTRTINSGRGAPAAYVPIGEYLYGL